MTALTWAMLALSVVTAFIGAIALHRVATPLERLHAGSFVTIAAGVPIVIAAFATDGLGARSLKLGAILIVMVLVGALANHAVARALLYRGGERR